MTLDEDVAVKLRAEARHSGEPFKQIVNRVLRLGLNAQAQVKASPPFKVKARTLGLRPGLSYDCIGQLLEHVEGPMRR